MGSQGGSVGTRSEQRLISVVVAVSFAGMLACSSEQPKPMQQPSPDQVRGHSDRGFDRLKQEERERKAVGQ